MGWFDWLKVRKKGPEFNPNLVNHDPDNYVPKPRSDLTFEPVFDIPNVNNPITVNVTVRNIAKNVLGRTEVINGVFRLSLSPTLGVVSVPENSLKALNQSFRTIQHELFHVLLWNTSYTHSNDEKSLLYYKVAGLEMGYTPWDIDMLFEAAASYSRIDINADGTVRFHTWRSLTDAVLGLNKLVGRELFTIQ